MAVRSVAAGCVHVCGLLSGILQRMLRFQVSQHAAMGARAATSSMCMVHSAESCTGVHALALPCHTALTYLGHVVAGFSFRNWVPFLNCTVCSIARAPLHSVKHPTFCCTIFYIITYVDLLCTTQQCAMLHSWSFLQLQSSRAHQHAHTSHEPVFGTCAVDLANMKQCRKVQPV